MHDDEIPIGKLDRNVPVRERHYPQEPIQWIENARLVLSDQRLSAPMVHIPNGKPAGLELHGFFLHPRQNLVHMIRAIKPSVLAAQRNLPVNADGEYE